MCALALVGMVIGVAPAAAQVASTETLPPVVAAAAPAASIVFPASVSLDDQQRAYRRGAGASSAVGARVFGLLELQHMTAAQSFQTVVGTSTLVGFGAGADITGISDGLFLRMALSEMSKSGTRTDGGLFPNGITVNVRMVPIDFAVGWRFNHLVSGNTVTPFIGGGALLLRYTETTPSGTSDDNVSSFFFGYEAFGGVDIRVSRVLTVAPEVAFRGVPNAIGKGGVSQSFNETDLGGVAFRITVGARFGGR